MFSVRGWKKVGCSARVVATAMRVRESQHPAHVAVDQHHGEQAWVREWAVARSGEGPVKLPFQLYPGNLRGYHSGTSRKGAIASSVAATASASEESSRHRCTKSSGIFVK
jgi:hypothetical protein